VCRTQQHCQNKRAGNKKRREFLTASSDNLKVHNECHS